MRAAAAMAKILADTNRHRHLFAMDRDNLGHDLCKAATDGVQECIAGEHDPDGNAWAPLSPKYEEQKAFEYPGQPMAVLHQVMANPHEVAGEVVVSADRATVTYGISEQARQEAEWFQEGNAHQPARRFWGFTGASLKEVRSILDKRFSTV